MDSKRRAMTHVLIQKACPTEYRWWFKHLYQPGLELMVRTMPGYELDTEAYERWKAKAAIQPNLSLQASATGRFPTAKATLYGVTLFLNQEHGEMWPETWKDGLFLKFALLYHNRVVARKDRNMPLNMELIATYKYRNDEEVS
jgi:hypothetical protein